MQHPRLTKDCVYLTPNVQLLVVLMMHAEQPTSSSNLPRFFENNAPLSWPTIVIPPTICQSVCYLHAPRTFWHIPNPNISGLISENTFLHHAVPGLVQNVFSVPTVLGGTQVPTAHVDCFYVPLQARLLTLHFSITPRISLLIS